MDIEEICNIEYDYQNIAYSVFENTVKCQNNIVEIKGPLNTSKNLSYLFLNKENVNINLGDLNHLVIRNCKNCNIYVNSSVSGIDVLYCSNVNIFTNNISYLEIWGSSNARLYFSTYQKIIVSYSLDIHFNDQNINTNLFSRRHYPPDEDMTSSSIQTYIHI